jgi:hypothetical protein
LAALSVPTTAERNGDFSWFQGQLYDPVSGELLPGNVIPPERIPDLMGWRVSTTGRAGGDVFVAKFSMADNTPAGSNVAVPLTSKVSVTYDSVSSSGTTAVTQTSVGPTPPSGFSLGVPPTYVELSTTATYSRLIAVCVSYAGTTFVDETNLKLLHFEGGSWIDRTVSLDTANDIICASVASFSWFGVFEPTLAAYIQPPIQAEGSSVFNAKRGVVPVKFTLTLRGSQTCDLPPATIALFRVSGDTVTTVNESDYALPSDSGSNFRISDCQYVYNLATSSLGAGTYRVDIRIGTAAVGSATFGLR